MLLLLQRQALIVVVGLLAIGPMVVQSFTPLGSAASLVSAASKFGQLDHGRSVSSALNALTERQMQFWEDVEDGLQDIDDYYRKEENGSQDLARVWKFCET